MENTCDPSVRESVWRARQPYRRPGAPSFYGAPANPAVAQGHYPARLVFVARLCDRHKTGVGPCQPVPGRL